MVIAIKDVICRNFYVGVKRNNTPTRVESVRTHSALPIDNDSKPMQCWFGVAMPHGLSKQLFLDLRGITQVCLKCFHSKEEGGVFKLNTKQVKSHEHKYLHSQFSLFTQCELPTKLHVYIIYNSQHYFQIIILLLKPSVLR